MGTKIVAVGDIHADYDKLEDVMLKLADKIDFEETRVVFLGDYVDGGLQARDVIKKLIEFDEQYPHWDFLMGNHEDMLLDAVLNKSVKYQNVNQWWQQGGRETFFSYVPTYAMGAWWVGPTDDLRDGIGNEHLLWLRNRPLMTFSDGFYFAHAGMRPRIEPKDQTMQDLLWIRDEFILSDYTWDKTVVYGHTFTDKPRVGSGKLGIDTMHHGHGVLTAVILDEDTKEFEVVQSFEEAPYKNRRPKRG